MRSCLRAAIVQAVYDKSIDPDQAHSYLCATSHFPVSALTPSTPAMPDSAHSLRSKPESAQNRPNSRRSF